MLVWISGWLWWGRCVIQEELCERVLVVRWWNNRVMIVDMVF